jgi:hypothetical protein
VQSGNGIYAHGQVTAEAGMNCNGDMTCGGNISCGGVCFFGGGMYWQNNGGWNYSPWSVRTDGHLQCGGTLFTGWGWVHPWSSGSAYAFYFSTDAGGVINFVRDGNYSGGVAVGPQCDERLKLNPHPSTFDALAAISGLDFWEYDMTSPIGGNAQHFQCMPHAQQINEIAPEAIIPGPALDDTGPLLSLNPAALVGYMLRAIQQLSERVAQLEGT